MGTERFKFPCLTMRTEKLQYDMKPPAYELIKGVHTRHPINIVAVHSMTGPLMEER